ncbi:hypothetical protein [Thermocatellispora tengchongensis]|uniref:hypothetical protein n=1 Tax=Thermocatellispora tengchongensis TaxID=1073253 RepID=UPI00363A94E5
MERRGRLVPPRGPSSELSRVDGGWRVTRTLDETMYAVTLALSPGAEPARTGPHEFTVTTAAAVLEVVAEFTPRATDGALPSFEETLAASRDHWAAFWSGGGAVDLSGSADPRAPELERRIVLSQYLTAIHCAGSYPPQETGLMVNSWRGRFHLEMHWWHGAHFPLWGRPELLERSLGWYSSILPRARETARRQGCAGARWPKQVGPDGRESPSPIGPFLVWQQPHPIYLAELVRRCSPGPRRSCTGTPTSCWRARRSWPASRSRARPATGWGRRWCPRRSRTRRCAPPPPTRPSSWRTGPGRSASRYGGATCWGSHRSPPGSGSPPGWPRRWCAAACTRPCAPSRTRCWTTTRPCCTRSASSRTPA